MTILRVGASSRLADSNGSAKDSKEDRVNCYDLVVSLDKQPSSFFLPLREPGPTSLVDCPGEVEVCLSGELELLEDLRSTIA